MMPYYCFALISIALYAILGSKMEKTVGEGYDVSPLQSVIGMLYANSGTGLMRWNMPLWYIPMIFVLLLMAFWIFRSKDNLKWNITVFLLSVLVAFILYEKISIGKKEEINAKEKSSGVGNTGDSIWWSENDADRYGYAVG